VEDGSGKSWVSTMKESLQLPMGVSEGEGVAMVERERERERGRRRVWVWNEEKRSVWAKVNVLSHGQICFLRIKFVIFEKFWT